MPYQILTQIAVTFVLSLLIGVEREQKQQKTKHFHFGGVRTFILIGLFGVITGVLKTDLPALIYVSSIMITAIIISSYFFHAHFTQKYGITTELAGLVTFMVGLIVSQNDFLFATVISLITASVMHFKSSLHIWAKSLESKDLISAIQFILIAFVILPLLPDQSYGPFGFFNPHQAWFMVVLITALSYLSYIAIKLIGSNKGICLTGFLAGFVSSTALTLSFAKQSLLNKKVVNPYAIAIIIASSAMFFRVIIEIGVINSALLETSIIPLATMGVVGVLSGLYFLLKKESTGDAKSEMNKIDNPLQILSALKFAGYFVAVLLLTRAATELFGDKGIYISSFLSGIVDVDAITVSLASLAKNGDITANVATVGITLAALTNTLMKFIFFSFLGNKAVTKKLLPVFILIGVVGLGLSAFFLL